MITIKIIEENNILKIKEDYAPVVCGNTNYQLEFKLGEDWNNIKEKTAIFIAEDHKTAVDLKNNVAKMPAMPNAQFVQVFLISAENEENRLLSSSVEIKLLPTKSAESLPEFKPLSAYVSEIISNINALQNGTIEVAKSKQAEFASNVSNPNLLINGDFKVNQRGGTTYTEAGKYTIDRWKLVSGSVEVKSNGIMLNGTIVQKLEHAPSIQVVASSNAGTISYSNGAVTLSTTTATLITYAKLEVGTTATPFSPRPHAEELALCQRYYEKIDISKNGNLYNIYKTARNSWMFYSPDVNFLCQKRARPTITVFSSKSNLENNLFCNEEQLDVEVIVSYTTTSSFVVSSKNGDFKSNNLFLGYFEADSEIY